MKHTEKIGKFNLLEDNVCDKACRCGWNIQIGGGDYKDYEWLKKILEEKQ